MVFFVLFFRRFAYFVFFWVVFVRSFILFLEGRFWCGNWNRVVIFLLGLGGVLKLLGFCVFVMFVLLYICFFVWCIDLLVFY